MRTLAIAYGIAGVAMALGALIVAGRAREKLGAAARRCAGAPEALGQAPRTFSFNNGAVGVDLMRDGRGAAFVLGGERDSFAIDLTRRPLDPLQSRGQFFYISEEGARHGRSATSRPAAPAPMASRRPAATVWSSATRSAGSPRRWKSAPTRMARCVSLAHSPRRPVRPRRARAPDQFRRNRGA